MDTAFTRGETVSILLLAIGAGCIPALQPLLLGGLLTAGRIDAAALGQIATIEAAGMLVGVTGATMLLPPVRLRAIALTAVAAIAAANVASAMAGIVFLPAARGVAGLAGGVLLWLLIGLLARGEAGGRLFAWYVTAQSTLAFALSLVFATWILPTLRSDGAYALLAILAVAVLAPAALNVPPRYQTLAASAGARLPSGRGGVGLAATFSFLAGVSALWTYLVPIGGALGQAPAGTARLVAYAIAFQIVGGLAATIAVQRLPATETAAACAALCLLSIAIMASGGGSLAPFMLGASVVSLLWIFTPPFHLAMILGLDPSGRSALYVGTAQIGGVSTGPLVASWASKPGGFPHEMTVAAAFFAVSITLCLAAATAWARNTARAVPSSP